MKKQSLEIKKIPNFKSLDFYKIPVKLKFVGAHFEMLPLFVWEFFVIENAIPVNLTSLFFYNKTSNLYNYNIKNKIFFFDSSAFSFYPFLSNLSLKTNDQLIKKFVKNCLIKKQKQRGLFFLFSINLFTILPLRKQKKRLKITRQIKVSLVSFLFKPNVTKKHLKKKVENGVRILKRNENQTHLSLVDVTQEIRKINFFKTLKLLELSTDKCSNLKYNLWF